MKKKSEVIYCDECLMPSSRPRIVFNDKICNGCNNKRQKENIDWQKRKEEFYELIKTYKKSNKYDCIVPWSGGKDSSMIACKIKFEFVLNPILVRFSPVIQTEIGSYNRQQLINLGFDQIFVAPNNKVAKILCRRFLEERGDPKIHWNAGINSTPLRVSIEKKIPLIFYAEHGDSQYGGNPINKESSKFKDLDEIYENLIGDDPRNWIDEIINENDIFPYTVPDENLLKKNKTNYSCVSLSLCEKNNN